jgi:hypothetical protein
MDGDSHFNCLALIRMRARPVADHPLAARDGGLGAGSRRVPGRRLPGHAPARGNEPRMTVALRGDVSAV